MVAAVEVVFGELVGDAVVGVGRQHQAAEHGLLGLDRLRRNAQLLDALVACGVWNAADRDAIPGVRSSVDVTPLSRTVVAILLLSMATQGIVAAPALAGRCRQVCG